MANKPKPEDPKQSRRFIEKAQEIADDDAAEAFERAVKKIVPPSPKPSSPNDA